MWVRRFVELYPQLLADWYAKDPLPEVAHG
jgi:hypothetical protein